MQQSNTKPPTPNSWLIPIALVFIFLNALGVPGQYTVIFGSWLGVVIEYTSFLMQIAIMLMTSADTLMDIKIVDLKKRYNSIYFFLVVLTLVSMLAAYSKKEEIVSCIRVSVTALFALWICDNLSVEEILERFLYAQMIFVPAAIIFYTLWPQYAANDGFTGFSRVKNGMAEELAVNMILEVVLLMIRWRKTHTISTPVIAFLALELVLLKATNGTGGLLLTIGIVAYMLMFCRQDTPSQRLPLGVVYIAGSVGFLLFALTIMPIMEPLFTMLGKSITITGRVPLWRQIIAVMQEHRTFIGYGYGLFWRDPQAVALLHAQFDQHSYMAYMTSGAHNNLIECWANIGLIGIGALFIALLVSFRNMSRLSYDQYLFCAGFMLFFMVDGWTERSLSTTYGFHLLLMFIAMGQGNLGQPEGEVQGKQYVTNYGCSNDIPARTTDDRTRTTQYCGADISDP